MEVGIVSNFHLVIMETKPKVAGMQGRQTCREVQRDLDIEKSPPLSTMSLQGFETLN